MNLQQEITLTLTVGAADYIIGALTKQPFGEVADMIAGIRHQVMSQLQPVKSPEPADAPAPEAVGGTD